MNESTQTVTIRRATKEDVQALETFYTENFPDKPILLDMDLWKWCFLQNHLQHSGVPFFVIEDRGVIKGGIGYLCITFHVGDDIYRGFHPVNFFVDTNYKGLYTLRLLRSVVGENQIGFVSYFTQDAAKLFKTARWIDLSQHVNNYYFSLGLSDASKKAFLITSKFKLVRSIKITWVNILSILLKLTRRSQSEIIRKTELDEELYPKNVPLMENRIGVLRDQAFLAWRYKNSPRLNCVYFYAIENTESTAMAVVHINNKANNAILMDIIESDCSESTLMSLIISIIKFCHSEHLYNVSTTMLNLKFHRILRKVSFSVLKSEFGLMVYADQKEVKNKLSEVQLWDYWIGHSDIY